MKSSLLRLLSFIILCFSLSPFANAQSDAQLRWVVPYPAGGGADFLARTISQAYSTEHKSIVIVDNKPGGNTSIAVMDVLKQPTNGLTILTVDNGTMVFNPVLYKKLSYDPNKDLRPVSLLGLFPMILVVPSSSDIKSVEQFLEKAKASTTPLNFGSAGNGSPHHLAMELLLDQTQTSMTHVSFKGAAPALQDLAGAHTDAMMIDYAAGAGLINGGKVRPLAVAHTERLSQLPNIPTFQELGYPEMIAAAQMGVVVKQGTSDEIVQQLQARLQKIVQSKDINDKLVQFGIIPIANNSSEYQAFILAEQQRWQPLIKKLNLSLD